MLRYDGREVENIPDFGSFKPIRISDDDEHYYVGLEKDVNKLPTYCGSGSRAKCADTGAIYVFEQSTKKWYKQPKNASGSGDGGSSGGSTNPFADATVEGDSLVIEV